MGPLNIRIQSSAIDLLQSIASRGEIDAPTLEGIEAATVSKLYATVHTEQLDLQNKLLHLLHSVLFAVASVTELGQQTHSSRITKRDDLAGVTDDDVGVGSRSDPTSRGDSIPTRISNSHNPVNPLLIQTLIDGLSVPSNKPLLQHWIDWILMTVPQFQRSLVHLVFPLSDCICRQLRVAVLDIGGIMDALASGTDRGQIEANIISGTTDSYLVMLLNALERLVLLGLTQPAQPEPSTVPEYELGNAHGPESGGLLGIVSGVFGAETSSLGTFGDDNMSVSL